MSSEDKGKLSSKRDRYWSVMLVGDHGRVIPFRHFKGLAIALCIGFILMLIAIVVMGILYTHQTKKLGALHTRISKLQQQNSKLRDEKDLYLTKLMLKKSKQAATSEKPVPKLSTGDAAKAPTTAEKKVIETKKPDLKPEKSTPVEKQPTKSKWMADIRKFSVSYDAKQEMLKAQFRIYNTSKPKKPLSGKSVIVFKNLDEPPIKWLTVPRMRLIDGKPPVGKGQPFRIRNYFTMRFRAYRQKAPIRYNAATAYVFSSEEKLLVHKDFSIKIDVPLPKPEKKAIPKSDQIIEKKPEPIVQETVDKPKEELLPADKPADVSGGTGTALPEPDTVPATDKKTAPSDPAPKTPAAEVSDDASPINRSGSAAEKETLNTPKPIETVPKP